MKIELELYEVDALLSLANEALNARKALFGSAGPVGESYQLDGFELIKEVERKMIDACLEEVYAENEAKNAVENVH